MLDNSRMYAFEIPDSVLGRVLYILVNVWGGDGSMEGSRNVMNHRPSDNYCALLLSYTVLII